MSDQKSDQIFGFLAKFQETFAGGIFPSDHYFGHLRTSYASELHGLKAVTRSLLHTLQTSAEAFKKALHLPTSSVTHNTSSKVVLSV